MIYGRRLLSVSLLGGWARNLRGVSFFQYKFIYLFIYLSLAVLGLRFCARTFSGCGERGPPFIAVRGPLTVTASLVAEHRLQMRRLSSCGSRAQLLRGMWDLPRPGLESVSPALAGRLSTAVPPGKPRRVSFIRTLTPITSYLPEWLSSKRTQITIVGKDVEKREPSYTVGGL